MTEWVSGIIVLVLTKLASTLMTKLLARLHGAELKQTSDQDIDAKLLAFKNAYKEAFNGQPVTADQQKKLKEAISDFVRGGSNGGL